MTVPLPSPPPQPDVSPQDWFRRCPQGGTVYEVPQTLFFPPQLPTGGGTLYAPKGKPMIPVSSATALLGQPVTIADSELLLSNVTLLGVRAHPDAEGDYLVDLGTGHCFTGSLLTRLERHTPDPDALVIPTQGAEESHG